MLDVVDVSSDESAGKTGALSVQKVIDCYLFYAESTNQLKVEEKSILLKEYQKDQPESQSTLGCAGVTVACAVLVESRLLAVLTPALGLEPNHHDVVHASFLQIDKLC
jgi:hypothetical protein